MAQLKTFEIRTTGQLGMLDGESYPAGAVIGSITFDPAATDGKNMASLLLYGHAELIDPQAQPEVVAEEAAVDVAEVNEVTEVDADSDASEPAKRRSRTRKSE